MHLNLDPRRLAILQEMGITLWLPSTALVPAAAPVPTVRQANAPRASALSPSSVPTSAPAPAAFAPTPTKPVALAARPVPASSAARPTPTPIAPTAPATAVPTWQMAPWVNCFAQASGAATGGAWLLLMEHPSPSTPFAGEVGALLQRMLQALGLEQHPQIWLAATLRPESNPLPLSRHAQAINWQPLEAQLPQALAQLQPARLLILGQHTAQHLLQSQAPVGQLRQQQDLRYQGIPAVVSYDPSFLLRTTRPKQYKAETWADLQRAAQLG